MEEEYKEKIDDLENRVKVLEKDLKKRKTMKIVGIVVRVIITIILVIAIYYGYKYVNEKYIKPYKSMLNDLSEVKNNVNSLKDYNSVIDKYISGFTK